MSRKIYVACKIVNLPVFSELTNIQALGMAQSLLFLCNTIALRIFCSMLSHKAAATCYLESNNVYNEHCEVSRFT